MKIQFIIFILIASLIIIGGHIFLYFSWVKFFMITSLTLKKILTVYLVILSMSFIITSLLILWRENVVTDVLYILASIWLGVAWYLFLAATATWIYLLASQIIGFTGGPRMVSSMLVLAALAYSGHGFWNAQRPIIKTIEVSMRNLPDSWHGRTAVQISDVHLGAVHRKSFFQKIIEQVKAINPDIVFITGDLFDGGGRNLNGLTQPLNELAPPLGVYFITGNHETYIKVDKVLAALKDINITILRDQIVDVDGVQVAGLDYPLLGQKKDVGAVLEKLDRSKANIVLYHEPTFIDQFKQYGVNLLLSGHTHRGQLWPFDYITRKYYHGNDYGLRRDGDFTLYTSTGVGTWGPPMRTANRPEIVAIHFE